MAFGQAKDDYPKKQRKIGSLWKSDLLDTKEVPLTGYLDLGIDARIKVTVRKNQKTGDKQPDYTLSAEVRDWQANTQSQAPKKPEVSDDDVPF